MSEKAESILHNWRERLEEVLKAKSLEDLKSELTKIGTDLQKEINSFDINAHLSPEAKARVKKLEKRYNDVLKSVHKAQKQFDREFNKAMRTMKSTQKDAEKRLNNIKKKVKAQKKQLIKTTSKVRKSITKKTAAKKKTTRKKTTRKKSTTNTAKA